MGWWLRQHRLKPEPDELIRLHAQTQTCHPLSQRQVRAPHSAPAMLSTSVAIDRLPERGLALRLSVSRHLRKIRTMTKAHRSRVRIFLLMRDDDACFKLFLKE